MLSYVQSVDKTVFVYIAVAWYDSPAKINVEGRNTTWAYIIPVRRNNLGAELFLPVEIRKFCPTSKTKIKRNKNPTLTSETMSSQNLYKHQRLRPICDPFEKREVEQDVVELPQTTKPGNRRTGCSDCGGYRCCCCCCRCCCCCCCCCCPFFSDRLFLIT